MVSSLQLSVERKRKLDRCKRRSDRDGRESGFTLIELLVVMAILALLAGLVAPRVIGYLGASRTKTAKLQIENISTSLELFRLDTGRYPSTEEGIAVLIARAPQFTNWSGPYLKGTGLPKDPWGQMYRYRSPGQNNPFDIYSLGSDGKEGGAGEQQDVTSW